MKKLNALLFATLLVVIRLWRVAEEERARLLRHGDDEYRARLSLEESLVRAHREAETARVAAQDLRRRVAEQEATQTHLAPVGQAVRRLIDAAEMAIENEVIPFDVVADLSAARWSVRNELTEAGLWSWLSPAAPPESNVDDAAPPPVTKREGSDSPADPVGRLIAAAASLENWQQITGGKLIDERIDDLTAARKAAEASRSVPAVPSPLRLAAMEKLVEACRGLKRTLASGGAYPVGDPHVSDVHGAHGTIFAAIAALDSLRIAGPRDTADPALFAPVGWTELSEERRQEIQAIVDQMRASSAYSPASDIEYMFSRIGELEEQLREAEAKTKIAPPTGQPFRVVSTEEAKEHISAIQSLDRYIVIHSELSTLESILAHRDHLAAQVTEMQARCTALALRFRGAISRLEGIARDGHDLGDADAWQAGWDEADMALESERVKAPAVLAELLAAVDAILTWDDNDNDYRGTGDMIPPLREARKALAPWPSAAALHAEQPTGLAELLAAVDDLLAWWKESEGRSIVGPISKIIRARRAFAPWGVPADALHAEKPPVQRLGDIEEEACEADAWIAYKFPTPPHERAKIYASLDGMTQARGHAMIRFWHDLASEFAALIGMLPKESSWDRDAVQAILRASAKAHHE